MLVARSERGYRWGRSKNSTPKEKTFCDTLKRRIERVRSCPCSIASRSLRHVWTLTEIFLRSELEIFGFEGWGYKERFSVSYVFDSPMLSLLFVRLLGSWADLVNRTMGELFCFTRLYICSLHGRKFARSVGRRDIGSPRQRDRTSQGMRAHSSHEVSKFTVLTKYSGKQQNRNEQNLQCRNTHLSA